MARATAVPAPGFEREAAEAYAVNDRMNQLLLEHLDARAWRAKAPGHGGRAIAGIFAHVHNIRLKWLRLSAPHLKLPARLDRARCTPKQASAALAESAALCCEMLAEGLAGPERRVQSFVRDGKATHFLNTINWYQRSLSRALVNVMHEEDDIYKRTYEENKRTLRCV